MPPLDFDAPGATATDSTDQPGEAVAVADEAAPEANAGCLEELNRDEVMPSLVDECEKEIEIANDSGHTTGIICDQSAAWVWAVHDGTAWRYGLKWEHALGSRSTPSRLMPGEGYSDARNALLSGLGIARMDMLGKDADMIAKIDAAIDELDAEGKLADEITDELQDRIDAGESDDMTPVHVVNTPQSPSHVSNIAHFQSELADASAELCAACLAEAECDAALKIAKSQRKAATERLQQLTTRGPEDRPLFDQQAEKPAEAVQVDVAAADPSAKGESWRECRFDDTAEFSDDLLPASIVNKLADANINTVGDLYDFQAKHGEFWAKEIKGIGKSKAEKISDAMIEFWKKHPQE